MEGMEVKGKKGKRSKAIRRNGKFRFFRCFGMRKVLPVVVFELLCEHWTL